MLRAVCPLWRRVGNSIPVRLSAGCDSGWRDLIRAWRPTLSYGISIVLVSYLVTWLAFQLGSYVLVFAALTGFVFLAPVVAIGLYEVSRQVAAGRTPMMIVSLRGIRRVFSNAMIFGLTLLIVFLVWARSVSMISIFLPMENEPVFAELWPYMLAGTMVGAVFAAITFAVSAFSLPMIDDRETDAVTAVVTSVNAVLRNKRAMLNWAAVIGTVCTDRLCDRLPAVRDHDSAAGLCHLARLPGNHRRQCVAEGGLAAHNVCYEDSGLSASGGGLRSSSSRMRQAGVSRSSNWPLRTAQKNATMAASSSTRPSGISRKMMLMAVLRLRSVHGPGYRPRPACTARPRRSALKVTSSELADMPSAASQGASMPVTASGTATTL